MPATLTARLRRFWLDVHLWIGAGLLVFLVPLGISGSVLVYRDAVEHALYPQRYAVTAGAAALPPSAYLDAAAKAFGPGVRPAQLRLPAGAGEPVVVSGRGRVERPGARPAMLSAWIDPPTGRVLAISPPLAGPVRLAHDLHGQMLIPQVGRKVVGWLGVAMLVNCLTGLWLWWPRGNKILKGLRWRRSPSTMMNLHHMAGFWILVPLAVLSATGAYISFPEAMRALSGVKAQQGGGPRGAMAMQHPEMNPDAAVARAIDGKSETRLVSLSLPSKGPRPAWRIDIKSGGGARTLLVDDATGAVRNATPPGGGDPVMRLMRLVREVHEGSAPGGPWRIIVFIAGFAPAILGVSGMVMWLRRLRREKAFRDLQA